MIEQAATRAGRIDFTRIAQVARDNAETVLRQWLPDGRRDGVEWVARNPRRADRTLGSFKVNLSTGRWADFAEGESGGDLISLAAYLFAMRQREAALRVAEMLGLHPYV